MENKNKKNQFRDCYNNRKGSVQAKAKTEKIYQWGE